MRSPFLERLELGPIIGDGAIGTELHQRGVKWGRSLDSVTLSDRAVLLGLHVDYLRAGAEMLTTNTFNANRMRLAEFDLAEKARELNIQAVKVAREAREITGRKAFVAGAVGPVVRASRGAVTRALRRELSDAFAEQVESLQEGGADLIILETFTDLAEIELALSACLERTELPVIACMSFDAEGRTSGEQTPQDIANTLAELGADVVGVNCSVGPQSAFDVLQAMLDAGVPRVAVIPNAGLPTRRGHDFRYLSTPDYFAEYAGRYIEAGASIVGGCCGTTPAHTAAMSVALGERVASPVQVRVDTPRAQVVLPTESSEASAYAPTRLAQALDSGAFTVSVELAPPKGVNPEKVVADAKLLEASGLDFVNITDSAMARVRMNAIAVAQLVQANTSLEAIIHYTTRDRNLMALQSELIGAHALGVRNVLALTGDPPSIGEYPDATGVWDVESMGLIDAVRNLNNGSDARGRNIGEPANFCVGCAVNPTAEDLDLELERFRQKLDAGARFVMSQPLFDIAELTRFLDRVGPIPVPFLLGVLPVQSYRHAEYMHNEVPGIEIPEAVRESMRKATATGAVAEGIRLARELISEAQPLVDGVYLMPSFGRYEICAEVLDAIDRTPTGAS